MFATKKYISTFIGAYQNDLFAATSAGWSSINPGWPRSCWSSRCFSPFAYVNTDHCREQDLFSSNPTTTNTWFQARNLLISGHILPTACNQDVTSVRRQSTRKNENGIGSDISNMHGIAWKCDNKSKNESKSRPLSILISLPAAAARANTGCSSSSSRLRAFFIRLFLTF